MRANRPKNASTALPVSESHAHLMGSGFLPRLSRLVKTCATRVLFAALLALVSLSGCASGIPPSKMAAQAMPLTTTAALPPEDMMNPIVLKGALTDIDALEKTLTWKPFRSGVEIARIYNTPDGGPSAAFLRYEPGASVPLHMHGGYEHIFILRGTQVDRSGEHGVGDVVINPPGSSHNVTSPNGCIVLIIWDKPVIIAP